MLCYKHYRKIRNTKSASEMRTTINCGFIISLFILSFAITIDLCAQDKETVKEKNEAHYGLKAGINFAELWG
jgi:hypothetical protein